MLLCIIHTTGKSQLICPWIFPGFSLSPRFPTFLFCWVQTQILLNGQHCTHICKELDKKKSHQAGLFQTTGNFLSDRGELTLWKISESKTITKTLTCKRCQEFFFFLSKSESVSHKVLSNSLWSHGLQPARLLCPWNSLGKNTGMGYHGLFQGIFPTQGLNLGLLNCKADS